MTEGMSNVFAKAELEIEITEAVAAALAKYRVRKEHGCTDYKTEQAVKICDEMGKSASLAKKLLVVKELMDTLSENTKTTH